MRVNTHHIKCNHTHEAQIRIITLFHYYLVVSIDLHASPEQSLDLVTVVLATFWVSKVRLLRVLSPKTFNVSEKQI